MMLGCPFIETCFLGSYCYCTFQITTGWNGVTGSVIADPPNSLRTRFFFPGRSKDFVKFLNDKFTELSSFEHPRKKSLDMLLVLKHSGPQA